MKYTISTTGKHKYLIRKLHYPNPNQAYAISNTIYGTRCSSEVEQMKYAAKKKTSSSFNPLAYTDVPETAGLARSINP